MEALYRRFHIPSIAIRTSVESSCDLFFDGRILDGITSILIESYSTRNSLLTICNSCAGRSNLQQDSALGFRCKVNVCFLRGDALSDTGSGNLVPPACEIGKSAYPACDFRTLIVPKKTKRIFTLRGGTSTAYNLQAMQRRSGLFWFEVLCLSLGLPTTGRRFARYVLLWDLLQIHF